MKIIKVEPEYNVEILGNNILIVSGHKGERVEGYERIIFKYKRPDRKKK